jgi:hypothetical protein
VAFSDPRFERNTQLTRFVTRPRALAPSLIPRASLDPALTEAAARALLSPDSVVPLEAALPFFEDVGRLPAETLRDLFVATRWRTDETGIELRRLGWRVARQSGHAGAAFAATFIDDPDPDVRVEAIMTLRDIGPKALAHVEQLEAARRDDSYEVRAAATLALFAIRAPDAVGTGDAESR